LKGVLWNDNPSWHGVLQGNNYSPILAAAGSLSEFPEQVKKVFLNQPNPTGIYALRFFIRGKPWIVTIDDDLLWNTKINNLNFAKVAPGN
jgi:hypothetical protein